MRERLLSTLAMGAALLGFSRAERPWPRPRPPIARRPKYDPEETIRVTKGRYGGATAKGPRFKGSKAAKAAARRVRRDLNAGARLRKRNQQWHAMAAGSRSGYVPSMDGALSHG